MIVVLSLLTAGCLNDVVREIAKDLTDTKHIHDELVKRYGEEVYVSINQGAGRVALNVTFTNSPLNDKTREDRATRAQETVNVVRSSYPGVERLSGIWVIFVRQKKTFIFVDERAAVDYYGFDNKGMRMSTSYGPSGTGAQLQTSTNYLKDEDETDISVSGIQLAGTPGEIGFTMLPHFRAKGDIRTAKSPPPKVVTFDFASYSNAQEFEPKIPVVVIADGRTVFKTTANFTLSTTSGSVNEFLYLPVPYPAFRSMVGSTEVTIKLGAKEFPLNAMQLAAMRDMCDYLTE
jgi:hypothetical protein